MFFMAAASGRANKMCLSLAILKTITTFAREGNINTTNQ
jgi:hypothetical protein